MVPEERLDFIDLETDTEEAIGDFPTGVVEYTLLRTFWSEPDEAINSVIRCSEKNVSANLRFHNKECRVCRSRYQVVDEPFPSKDMGA